MLEIFTRWEEIDPIVQYWLAVTTVAAVLSLHLFWLTVGDLWTERGRRSENPLIFWTGIEFLGASALGFLMRLLYMAVGLIVAYFELGVVGRTWLVRWPLLLAGAVTVALAINVWQEIARYRLNALLKGGDS